MTPSSRLDHHKFHGLVLVSLLVAVLAACSKVPENAIARRPQASPQQSRNYDRFEREARGAFLKEPRNIKAVELSAQKYKEAIAIRADEYGVLWEAARSCLWLGRYGREDGRKDAVKQGLEYANTAVRVKPQGEEGLFFLGALAGQLSELDFTYGSDAIKIIEGRMTQLIQNKSTYLYGGPDRVLAIVYMRAPGPPLSVGDYDKAQTHMRRAMQIESDWLENQLYMAELEFRLGKKNDDPEATKRARGRLQEYFLRPGVKPPMAMGSVYEYKEWQKEARKLDEKYM